MASAAAVAVDEDRSPVDNDLGEDDGRPGEITSGISGQDEEVPGANGEQDDEEDGLPSNPLSKRKAQQAANGDLDDDLFGDNEGVPEQESEQPARRLVDDEELDSGDDEGRMDRAEEEPQQEYIAQERVTMDLELPRQAIPEPSDNEMYLLKLPSFMAIEPHAWDHKTFQPPTTDHHSNKAPSETFSAYNTALTTIRWRHSPSNPSQLQSNARVNRWSDGSLTLQLASDPTVQYEIDGNALAPPQRNPVIPTPTSIRTTDHKSGRYGANPSKQAKDAYTYLIRPHPETGTMIVTHKITAGLSIRQSGNVEDDAIARLQASLAAASNASKVEGGDGIGMKPLEVNPEAAKLAALKAVRDAELAEKKRVAAQERELARSERVLGRKGLGSNRYNGLNVGMLEDDEEMEGGGRGRSSLNKQRKPRRRRNSEYSEDEDFGRKRFSREDEYDEEDDFLAPSDEEEVVEDDDDDPDDGIVEESTRRERTPKRDREDDDDEADAPGEEEDEADVQAARATKRRRVVEDDDEDE